MKFSALLILTFFSFAARAQKVTVKNDVIYEDEKRYAYLDRFGCGAFNSKCTVVIKDTDEKHAMEIRFDDKSYAGYTYAYMTFTGIPGTARIEDLSKKNEKIAKMIVKAKLLKNGRLDPEAVSKFIAEHP